MKSVVPHPLPYHKSSNLPSYHPYDIYLLIPWLLLDNKYLNLVDILLQSTLFSIDDGLTMEQLVKFTSYTEQTIRKMIKNINKDITIIKIDNTNKPYKYTIDIENI